MLEDKKLPYSDEEICREYREAKDKNKKISILADMCLCDEKTILDVLTRNGAISGVKPPQERKVPEKKQPKKKKAEPFRFTAEMEQQLERYYAEGMPAQEIAEWFGCNRQVIYDKIHARRLPDKYPKRERINTAVKTSDTDKEYINELERLLKEKDAELVETKAALEEVRTQSDKKEEIAARIHELEKDLKAYMAHRDRAVIEVINTFELLTVLFAGLKERLPDDMIERITVRTEGMAEFLRWEV